jgi:hypothetical protein
MPRSSQISNGERDYSHRDVVDKLGIKPGHALALAGDAGYLEAELLARILDRLGRPLAETGEPLDIALVELNDQTDPVATLAFWRQRLRPNGGIWLLTRKRGRPGYVDQTVLIYAGPAAGVVDNKICSVSDTISAMRFVIRRSDRK